MIRFKRASITQNHKHSWIYNLFPSLCDACRAERAAR